MFLSRESYHRALTDCGFSAELIEDHQRLARQAARLDHHAGHPRHRGASRIGGAPDLPEDFAWPTRADGTPLGFLAQIDLADVVGMTDLDLPESGWLVFFYDLVHQPWGDDPAESDGFRLHYIDCSAEDLVRAPAPQARRGGGAGLPPGSGWQPRAGLNGPRVLITRQSTLPLASVLPAPVGPTLPASLSPPSRPLASLAMPHSSSSPPPSLPPHRLSAHPFLDTTAWDERLLEGLAREREAAQRLSSHCEVDATAQSTHQLGGCPHYIWDERLPLRAAVVAAGHRFFDASPELKESLSSEADHWVLLAQFDSHPAALPATASAGWSWGESGMIYIFIDRRDLAVRDFSRAHLILESY